MLITFTSLLLTILQMLNIRGLLQLQPPHYFFSHEILLQHFTQLCSSKLISIHTHTAPFLIGPGTSCHITPDFFTSTKYNFPSVISSLTPFLLSAHFWSNTKIPTGFKTATQVLSRWAKPSKHNQQVSNTSPIYFWVEGYCCFPSMNTVLINFTKLAVLHGNSRKEKVALQ